jgi:hypothetical protein
LPWTLGKAVEWIEIGCDCLEDYQHEVSYREDLDELIRKYGKQNQLPKGIRHKLDSIDRRFKEATVDSDLSIWGEGRPGYLPKDRDEPDSKEYYR